MLKKYFMPTKNRKVLQAYQERGKITLKIFRNDYMKAFDLPEAVAEISTEQAADLILAIREETR